MNRIIMLDIDGVLNGHEWCHLKHGPRIMPRPADVLNTIITKSAASLVIASSWSSWIRREHMKCSGFSRMLASHGIDADVIDCLDVDGDPQHRSKAIKDWHKERPELIVVSIDDLPLTVPNHVRPHPSIGLEPRHVSEVLERFGLQNE